MNTPQPASGNVKRIGQVLIFMYGVLSYVTGLGGFVFFMLFIGGWDFLPFQMDSRPPGPIATAVSINLGLIGVFGLQHTLLARQAFKNAWATIFPKAAERSTYVLLSGILMFSIGYFWCPLGGTIWHFENSTLRIAMTLLQLAGWTLVVTASFAINHFELFGLQQTYFNLANKPTPPARFTERFLYKKVRHPLQLGLLIGIWSTSTMTATHLMLSVTMSLYILIGLYYEEKDLVATLGAPYEDYRQRVRMLLPLPK